MKKVLFLGFWPWFMKSFQSNGSPSRGFVSYRFDAATKTGSAGETFAPRSLGAADGLPPANDVLEL